MSKIKNTSSENRWRMALGATIAAAMLHSPPGYANECIEVGLTPAEETVSDAYIAYYQRPADTAGLAFWSEALRDAGGRLDSIIGGFANSQEFDDRFGSLSAEDLINNIYQRLFDRQADPVGLSFYIDELQSGRRTLETIALDILNGAQNEDLDVLNNKRAVSADYLFRSEESGLGLPAMDLADILTMVTAAPGSASASCDAVEMALNELGAPNASFEIAVVNLTSGQPLSPLAVLAHQESISTFSVGQAASAGLELLAEGGDSSQLIAETPAAATASGTAPVGPGASDMVTIELDGSDTSGMHLSVLTMLVNTNDAITGMSAESVEDMIVGETRTYYGVAYDAGTEANTERADTIPGPAGGGEGFNASRDDIRDQVTMHGGVVTSDDGLAESALDQAHRFDNPVALISITRTQ